MSRQSNVDRLPPDAEYHDVFARYVRPGRPFVLSGAAAKWSAVEKWTAKFLSGRYGAEPVDFLRCGTQERVQRNLADYFALSRWERSSWYLVDWDFRRRCPELLRDFSIPEMFRVDWLEHIPSRQRPDLLWIYIGHPGSRGSTHRDNFGSNAWLAVVRGVKRVVFPTFRSDTESVSGIDLFDEADDPRLLHCANALLEAGDVLFVPAGSWHAARNETYCLSVTGNFVDGSSFADHRAFATRGWLGRAMLSREAERLHAAADPEERECLRLHIEEALRSYRQALDEELRFVGDLRARLDEAGSPDP